MSLPRLLTAIVTPFLQNTNVDIDSLLNLIDYQFSHPNVGVVLFGTTGECPTLTDSERDIVLECVSKKYNDFTKFVIGVGGNNTYECIEKINSVVKYGFNNFMLTTPYYNKPTQLGLEKHFQTICNEFPDFHFIIYNVPSRCGVNLLPNTVLNICNLCKNIVAIKEASGDLSQMIMVRRLVPDLTFYCGDDGLVVPAMSIGAYGVISVLSNYNPRVINDIINYCIMNNYSEAFKLYSFVDEIIKLLFSETNPSPIKYMLKVKDLIPFDTVRLPLVEMQNSNNKDKLIVLDNKLQAHYFVVNSKRSSVTQFNNKDFPWGC
jgi:4-hydroxy-tetrahydrodipicolinate synthase